MIVTKRSKQFATHLKNNLQKGKVLVVMHDNPDPDCFATGLCLRKIFSEIYKQETVLAYGGVIGRAENRKMLRECDIPVTRMKNIKSDDYNTVFTVDCQPTQGNVTMKRGMTTNYVLDHHPRNKLTRNIDFVDIRTKYGATSTIAFEYCLAHNLDFNKKEATAIIYAIKTETKDLGMEAGAADRRAYLHLLPKSDFNVLFNIVNAEVSPEYFNIMAKALENAHTYKDAMISNIEDIGTPEYVAETADTLLRMKGIRWTLVFGRHQTNMILSIRTNIREADAGEIMNHLVEGIGSGGGHDTMAGGKIEQIANDKELLKLEQEISKRFLQALKIKSPGKELI